MYLGTVSSNTAITIMYLSKACMLAQKLEVKLDVDFESIKKIHVLNRAFNNATMVAYPNFETKVAQLSFGFEANEQNYKDYVSPWVVRTEYYSELIKHHLKPACKIVHESNNSKCGYVFAVISKKEVDSKITEIAKKFDSCPRCGGKLVRFDRFAEEDDYTVDLEVYNTQAISESPEWSFFFEMINCLSISGFIRLKTAFQSWAFSILMDAVSRISQVVSLSVYENSVSILKKEQLKESNEQ